MYKLCKTEQSATRQRQLEEGLLRAMETQRYEDISVSDLCDGLQIPRKSFYRYFASKDGALQALLDHTLMEFDVYTVAGIGGAASVYGILERFFRFWHEKKSLLDALRRSGLTGLLIERAVAFSLTDEIFPKQYLPYDSPLVQQHVTTFCVCGLMSMVVTWHGQNFPTPEPEMARIAVRMLSQPLFSQIPEATS